MTTKRERKIIRECIDDLMGEDGNFARGIGRLCELVGWEYPAWHAVNRADLEAVNLRDIPVGQSLKLPGMEATE